jgi:hypothetical protein
LTAQQSAMPHSSRLLRRATCRFGVCQRYTSPCSFLANTGPLRHKSTAVEDVKGGNRNQDGTASGIARRDQALNEHVVSVPRQEVIRFPSSLATPCAILPQVEEASTPVLLNSKEHAVGYLSKILNARVYDAAIETELQEAKNLSTVRCNRACRLSIPYNIPCSN